MAQYDFARVVRGKIGAAVAAAIYFSATLPTLPTMFTTTYSLPSAGSTPHGSYWVCNTASDLTTALSSCALGDVIQLTAGNTFTGNFTLPDKGAGTAFVYIVSSAIASLPAAGTRVGASDASNMPKIVASGGNTALTFAASSHHWRFVGIEVTAPSSTYVNTLIAIGSNANMVSTCPNNITFDRCYVHGDATAGARRCFAAHGKYIEVTECYVTDAKEVSADSQAIWSCHGPGPYRYYNNELAGCGETVLFGGALPGAQEGTASPDADVNLIPSDIYIAYNLFKKPSAWASQTWTSKNLLEFKLAKRVLVEKNHFENSQGKDQHGYACLITPRDEHAVNPPVPNWFTGAETSDITFRYNRAVACSQGMSISGIDDGDTLSAFGRTSQRSKRIYIHDNYFNLTNSDGGSTTFDGRVFQINGGPESLVIDHNTLINQNGTPSNCMNLDGSTNGSVPCKNFVYTNNITIYGVYGWLGTSVTTANSALALYAESNFAVKNNAFIDIAVSGSNSSTVPSGNFFPTNVAGVSFTDSAGGDYSLGAGSAYKAAGKSGTGLTYSSSGTSDGSDMGANFALVAA